MENILIDTIGNKAIGINDETITDMCNRIGNGFTYPYWELLEIGYVFVDTTRGYYEPYSIHKPNKMQEQTLKTLGIKTTHNFMSDGKYFNF